MTMWAYVVAFDNSVSRDKFLEKIDKIDGILNWYSCLPNAVFVVSNFTAAYVSRVIKEATGIERLIVLDAATDRNGCLPTKAWEFLQRPLPVGQTK